MIHLSFSDAFGASAGRYRLAGRPLLAQPSLERLAPFAEDGGSRAVRRPAPGFSKSGGERLIRRVIGVVGDAERPIESWRTARGHRLVVPELASFAVEPLEGATGEGGGVAVATDGAAASELVVSAALGPALVFALSLLGTWCLHAAAVARRGRAIALVGPSGVGKSTLAAFLERAGWQLLADDVLPIGLPERGGREGAVALPAYPQPRWPAARQQGRGAAPAVSLAAVVVLGRPAAGSDVRCERLAGGEALSTVLLQTVGASLHGPELLERHLAFAATAVAAVPVHRLSYPFGASHLPAVAEALERSIS